MTPVTIITGASAGIGSELARVFARHGHAVVLVARREAQLKALAAEIAASGQTVPLVLPVDLSLPDAVSRIEKALAAHNFEPEFIVNNAGFGLIGPAATADRAELLAMIDLNVRLLTDLSLAFLDSVTRRKGGVLNVASVAGFLPGPGSAVYYASKAFVLSFTEALHHELKPQGVRVTALCPGPVETEFQVRAGLSENKVHWPLGVPAARVAEEGYQGLIQGRRLVIPGFLNKVLAFLPRIFPRSLVLTLVGLRQSKRREMSKEMSKELSKELSKDRPAPLT